MGSDLAPERPRSIGKYLLIATIGSGGMAEVFLAAAKGPAGFNKLLVTKVLRPALEDDESFRVMFLDEARLAARMNHPNVPQTYEVGESDGHHFLTMEYLEGQPLHRVVQKLKDQLPLDMHARVLSLVLAGLHYAHELTDYDGSPLEVVHRDVTPHNVFVTYDGQVKLMDFGIAKTAHATSRTATGVIKGKISYLAPEQANSQPLDRRADIFAVGVMLWEALAGRRLNAEDGSEVATLQRRMTTPVEDPRTVKPDAPEELAEICRKAVAFDPKDRYATAAEMQEALETYLEAQRPPAKMRDLGKLLVTEFAPQRERIKQAIERQLAVAEASGSALTLVDLARDGTGSRAGADGEASGGGSGASSAGHSGAHSGALPIPGEATSATLTDRTTASRWLTMMAVPIAALVAIGAGVFFAHARDRAQDEAKTTTANASGATTTVEDAGSTTTTAAAIDAGTPMAPMTASAATSAAPPSSSSAPAHSSGGAHSHQQPPGVHPPPAHTIDEKDPYAP